ncbi:MAG: cyclodeaminase/cyclohydrolase family protein [Blastocatellia bacterium]
MTIKPTESMKPSASIGEFAELIAAGTPAPGGGSVAAYCGVLATSLGRMMCNLTMGKTKYAAVEGRVEEIDSELRRLGDEFRSLIDDDAESFNDVLAAYRLPKDSEEAKAERSRKIETALRHAIDTPYHTAELAVETLDLLGELAALGNPNALPDLTNGAQLARTAVRGAYYNVEVNLAGLTDAAAAADIRTKIAALVEHSERLSSQVEAAFKKQAL